MSRDSEAGFWIVAVTTAMLYGLMASGRFWDAGSPDPSSLSRQLLHTVFEAYGWLPSFLAGLIVRRRAILLAVIAVLAGGVLADMFRGMFAPNLFLDDWDPPIVDLLQKALAIACAAVAAMAGQFLAKRSGPCDVKVEGTRRDH